MGILLSKFRFNFNAIQTLISRLHGELCHIRFGYLQIHVNDFRCLVRDRNLVLFSVEILCFQHCNSFLRSNDGFCQCFITR